MRLCFLIPAFSDGGAQIQCIRLLNALQHHHDLDLHLIRLHRSQRHDNALDRARITVHELPSRSHFDPRNVLAIVRIVRRLRPDILMTWIHVCDVYGFGVRALTPGLKWVMTERDCHYPPALRFRLRAILGRSADAIVANSRAGEALWRGRQARAEITVIDNIVAPAKPPSSDRENLVVCVGRLEPQKNVLAVANAFCTLARKRPGWRFVFVGDGSLAPQVSALIDANGVGEQVHLAGFSHDVPSLLARARALVTMSHHEGLPNAVLEAVQAQTPVLASDIAPHRDLLGAHYPWLVRDRHDPAAVAQNLDALLETPDAAGCLEFAGRRIAPMTPDAVADRYRDIFFKLSGAAVAQEGLP